MVKDVFDFDNYRDYVKQALDSDGERGKRTRLAEALRCQPAFVSRVLSGEADFSQEHGVVINQFLQHREEESEFFMTLLDLGRAGSKALQDYHRRRLAAMRAKRLLIAERIGIKQSLSQEDQLTYYSSWHYAAIHMLLLVPEMNSPQKIADSLRIPVTLVKDVLDFLVATGLATTGREGYRPGIARMHLAKNSPMLNRHHTNWRLRAIAALDLKTEEQIHYSGPICISREVAAQIREKLLRLLSETEPLIQNAKDEYVYCLNLDLFRV
ncbi:MAG: TIGR02147 family protein [Oligoflexia bacterium]|nr:TIGR02147 family protein [Oligoflexia bacterium]